MGQLVFYMESDTAIQIIYIRDLSCFFLPININQSFTLLLQTFAVF